MVFLEKQSFDLAHSLLLTGIGIQFPTSNIKWSKVTEITDASAVAIVFSHIHTRTHKVTHTSPHRRGVSAPYPWLTLLASLPMFVVAMFLLHILDEGVLLKNINK